jgi:hypothetical protein
VVSGFSRSPKLLKGALVQFSAPMIVPIPNIIIFQYNPESLSRTLQPFHLSESTGAGEKAAPSISNQTQPFDPTETFSLSLVLDASDALEVPESHPVAALTGVADRIAALEMLLYPSTGSGLSLSISVGVSLGGALGGDASLAGSTEPVPKSKAPTVLFVWGPGRIVPVRLTTFTVEEQQNNTLLYPVRAKIALGMLVLTETSFREPLSTEEKIAVACYQFTMAQKQVLALANLANGVESILGMLPF